MLKVYRHSKKRMWDQKDEVAQPQSQHATTAHVSKFQHQIDFNNL
jgi:hypothetical protein